MAPRYPLHGERAVWGITGDLRAMVLHSVSVSCQWLVFTSWQRQPELSFGAPQQEEDSQVADGKLYKMCFSTLPSDLLLSPSAPFSWFLALPVFQRPDVTFLCTGSLTAKQSSSSKERDLESLPPVDSGVLAWKAANHVGRWLGTQVEEHCKTSGTETCGQNPQGHQHQT